MARLRKAQLLEDVGAALALLLRLQIDVIGLLGVLARADEDELRAFVVEQPRVLGREPAPAKLFLQRLQIPGFLLLAQSRGARPSITSSIRSWCGNNGCLSQSRQKASKSGTCGRPVSFSSALAERID